jgi:formylglycine-generating enzyme required for sulfatase activity
MRRCPHCKERIPWSVDYCPYCAGRMPFDWWFWLNREKGGLLLGVVVTLWVVFVWLDLAGSAIVLQTEEFPVTRLVEVTRAMTATAAPTVPVPTPRPTRTPTPMPGQPVATRYAAIDGAGQLLVPAGHFLMGTGDQQWADTVGLWPRRTVYLEAFWIDRLEVNNGQFAAFLNASGNQLEQETAWLSLAHSQIIQQGGEFYPTQGYGEHPVTFVSWYGAAAYCQWAGRRLPTDAEWEKAARGSLGFSYPWGEDEPNCQAGNYGRCAGATMPGGSYPIDTSPYGAQDMFGNVSEWVDGWEGVEHWDTAVQPAVEALSDRMRVVRGSGWPAEGFGGLTFYRSALHPGQSGDSLGFRCAEDGE